MTNAELIKALRNCAATWNTIDDCDVSGCPFTAYGSMCIDTMMRAAAYALEDADKRNAELLKKCKEKEKLIAELEAQNKLKDGTITAMETDIGKLQAAVDNYEKLIAELSAQLPKQAHWVAVDNGHGVCSNCNRQDSIDNMATHCRYCGSKMKKGEWE